jgi:hypothetical protein
VIVPMHENTDHANHPYGPRPFPNEQGPKNRRKTVDPDLMLPFPWIQRRRTPLRAQAGKFVVSRAGEAYDAHAQRYFLEVLCAI